MNFGSLRDIKIDIDGSRIVTNQTLRKGSVVKTIIEHNPRYKVKDTKEEFTEYMKFRDRIQDLRTAGKLLIDDRDKSTYPHFTIDFPKFDVDGGYFVVCSWVEKSE